jgi:hypothetical protein
LAGSGLGLASSDALALRRRAGLALGDVLFLAGAGSLIPILGALTLRARTTLLLIGRLLGPLGVGLALVPTLVLGSIIRSPRIVTIGSSLAYSLALLTFLALLILLCAILAGVALVLFLAGLALLLASIARPLGTTVVPHAGFIALRAA